MGSCRSEPWNGPRASSRVRALQGRADALARLRETPVSVKLETEDFGRGFAEGLVGLMASYELLRRPGSGTRTM